MFGGSNETKVPRDTLNLKTQISNKAREYDLSKKENSRKIDILVINGDEQENDP